MKFWCGYLVQHVFRHSSGWNNSHDGFEIYDGQTNAENYFNWKFKMEMFLQREKAWTAVTTEQPETLTEPWREANGKALAAIACVLRIAKYSILVERRRNRGTH